MSALRPGGSNRPPGIEDLARCQLLLREGHFVADICYLQAEAPPQGFGSHPRNGYDWDECSADVVLDRMQVIQNQLVLPDGMTYRVLVLPPTTSMTPALLNSIRKLAKAGATIIGAPPEKSPSLSHYPKAEAELKIIVDDLLGRLRRGQHEDTQVRTGPRRAWHRPGAILARSRLAARFQRPPPASFYPSHY